MALSEHVIAQIRGQVGCITLNRPKALNALSLAMVRAIAAALASWAQDPRVVAVAFRGSGKDADAPHFGHFCAGGDIRFFHAAALSGNPELEDFFTEEYALNHQISAFPKPMLWLLDGVVMGGGMGLCAHDPRASQFGAPRPGLTRYRIGTERTQAAMPETHIGLFPDVGGGWFLARSDAVAPGLGEYLALTGQSLNAREAAEVGWLDGALWAKDLAAFWANLGDTHFETSADFGTWLMSKIVATNALNTLANPEILTKKAVFAELFTRPTVASIVSALEAQPLDPWCVQTATTLRQRSPLLLCVTLAQLRRARASSLADALRMERGMVRHCFHAQHLGKSGSQTDTAEGIRALAIDKDHAPRWQPERIEDITPDLVNPFFDSPWPASAHPLRHLS